MERLCNNQLSRLCNFPVSFMTLTINILDEHGLSNKVHCEQPTTAQR